MMNSEKVSEQAAVQQHGIIVKHLFVCDFLEISDNLLRSACRSHLSVARMNG